MLCVCWVFGSQGRTLYFLPAQGFQRGHPDGQTVGHEQSSSCPHKEFPSEHIYFRLCGDHNQQEGTGQHLLRDEGEGGGGGERLGTMGVG